MMLFHLTGDKAHILVCFLAFVLWKTLGQLVSAAGLGDEPRKVFDEIAQIHMVDVVMPTSAGRAIRRRCIAQPTKHPAGAARTPPNEAAGASKSYRERSVDFAQTSVAW